MGLVVGNAVGGTEEELGKIVGPRVGSSVGPGVVAVVGSGVGNTGADVGNLLGPRVGSCVGLIDVGCDVVGLDDDGD